VLILKIFFKNKKKYYFDMFWNEKHFKKQPLPRPQTHSFHFIFNTKFIYSNIGNSIQLYPTPFILFLRHFVLPGCYRYAISYNFQPGFTLKIEIIYYEGIVGACSSTSIPNLSISRGYIDVVTYTNLFSS
jgi:hypothetical protein